MEAPSTPFPFFWAVSKEHPKKTINVLRKLYHVDISKISKIKLSNNTRKEIDDFINEYYDRYSGLYLKSKNFLKSIKNVYI